MCTGSQPAATPIKPTCTAVECYRMSGVPAGTATLHRQPGRSQLAAPAHARQEARRSSLERRAPAIAGSRNFRTGKARRPGLPGTPRGSRVRTDHTSHSSPATCQSAAGIRCPSCCTVLICSPLHICFPAGPLLRTSPGPELVRTAPVIVVAAGRRPAPAAGSRGRRTARPQPALINTERPPPLPDTARPGFGDVELVHGLDWAPAWCTCGG